MATEQIGATPPKPDGGKRRFTPEQISVAKSALEKNPALMRELISSAQGGNEEDLKFMMESGLSFWSEEEGRGEF